jgi:hypothetical protein
MKVISMRVIPKFSVEMALWDLLYVSYLIPAARLRASVPDSLSPAILDGDKVFISLVIFRTTDVRVVGLPAVRFAYSQVNLRTYVVDPMTGKPAVLFLRSGITSRVMALATGLLRVPWENIPFSLKAEQDRDDRYIRYSAQGNWEGFLEIEAAEEGACPARINPFSGPEEGIRYLTAPTVGLYHRDGRMIRFEVLHSEIRPREGRVLNIRFPLLTDSGVLTETEIRQPDCVLLAPSALFRVYLPPETVRGNTFGPHP